MQPVGLRSIRWQLPLTYAAIALVAAVALSALLIGLLRQYYAQQEFDILDSSSRGLARFLSFRLDAPLSQESLPNLVSGVQFVPDYRVELLDPNGEVVFDTGLLDAFTVTFDSADGPSNLIGVAGRLPQRVIFGPVEPPPTVEDSAGPSVAFTLLDTQDAPGTAEAGGRLTATRAGGGGQLWQVASPIFGVDIAQSSQSSVEPVLLARKRSDASVTRLITGVNGQVIGFVRLSNPPAVGSALIDSVTEGACVAGTGAVLIAAILGWWISLRLTRPLMLLTEATARMTRGDLSVRVEVPRSDELGALANSFNTMAGQVEHTIAALRRFVADAAHELHTPLTAIKTNLELTKERPDQARLTEAVAQIGRLEALADDLLDLSRLEVAEAPRVASVDVGELVREVSEIYASRAEQAGVEFALMMGDPLPNVRANDRLLRRALSNLLDNAVKFTPSGGDVLLATSVSDGSLQFVIEDSGIGIPSDDLPALFSRFHRGSNTANLPGSGLGLAIVKAIADAHHGSVKAESTGRGSRFVLRLPVGA